LYGNKPLPARSSQLSDKQEDQQQQQQHSTQLFRANPLLFHLNNFTNKSDEQQQDKETLEKENKMLGGGKCGENGRQSDQFILVGVPVGGGMHSSFALCLRSLALLLCFVFDQFFKKFSVLKDQ